VQIGVGLSDPELGSVVRAGKESAANRAVDERVGISSRMYTPVRSPVGPSHSTAMRWAAFSLRNPSQPGKPAGRMSPKRIRQIPATDQPFRI